MISETFVAVLTPPGRGAVATVAIRGPQALAIAARRFAAASGRPLSPSLAERILFGRFQGSGDSAEEVALVLRGETDVEIHCHGGSAAARQVVDSLVGEGAEEVSWEEMLRQSSADPFAIEARIALSAARTTRTCEILLNQLRGALSGELAEIERLMASGQREEAAARLDRLASLVPLGLHLTRPWRVVVAGPPNVGKSSLINAILGYERSIVFDEPGTTRDVLAAGTAIDGWPVELIDTAGLRAAGDELEAEGIARARGQIEQADLVLAVEDASQPGVASPNESLERPFVCVGNKSDLLSAAQQESWRQMHPAGVLVSAKSGDAIAELCAAIGRRLVPLPPEPGQAVPFLPRHRELIEALRRA